MGKPSSTSLSRPSERSIQTGSFYKQRTKITMSAYKMEQMRKKHHNHVKRNIKKLFHKLKQESRSRNNSTQNTTGSSLDLTIVVPNDSFTPEVNRKRSISPASIPLPKKSRKNSDSLIIVDDETKNDDSVIVVSPPRSKPHINCSTPIAHRDSTSIKNLIINNFPKSQNNETIQNKTIEINKDSYLTIDLTTESVNKTNTAGTVIDLEKSTDDTHDCTVVSVSEANLSMSGDSDITVLQNNNNKNKMTEKQIRNFTSGIAKLNSTERGKLLEIITQKIFSGCNMNSKSSLTKLRTTHATDTEEDAYIKEVILGENKPQKPAEITHSRNSVGSNIYHPSRDTKHNTGLRMIIIDGSNVAMEHTKGRCFSVQGLKICIDYFLRRGHNVKAFVPRFRCKYGKSSDPALLDQLERQGLVVYTPSREIQGKACVPYDDRYIIQCAAEFDGVIVSGDNYRDLINENPRWKYIIENRVLPFTWVNNMIMFPKDPFGRGGPSLESLLKHPTPSIFNEVKNNNQNEKTGK